MSFIFAVFPIMFILVFVLVFGTTIYTMSRGIKQERKNNHSPRLTVEAKVVAKRTNFRRHNSTDHHMSHSHTSYFVTFEVASGDRMELPVQGHEYGLLVEGDFGDLTFQGTRYLGFQRKAKTYENL